LASFEARISLITSSILATAMASPTRIWARSRALPSRCLVRARPPPREGEEALQQVLQVHHQRTAAVERHDVGAEGRLQRGEAVQLVSTTSAIASR